MALLTARDLVRSKPQLVVENALLRQQLIILKRGVKKPTARPRERGLMVLLSRLLPSWEDALMIVRPDTLLKWHRLGFRLFWRQKTRVRSREPRIGRDTVELIREMAEANRTWGAEKIRGELLKLGIRVAKRTIRQAPPHRAQARTIRSEVVDLPRESQG